MLVILNGIYFQMNEKRGVYEMTQTKIVTGAVKTYCINPTGTLSMWSDDKNEKNWRIRKNAENGQPERYVQPVVPHNLPSKVGDLACCAYRDDGGYGNGKNRRDICIGTTTDEIAIWHVTPHAEEPEVTKKIKIGNHLLLCPFIQHGTICYIARNHTELVSVELTSPYKITPLINLPAENINSIEHENDWFYFKSEEGAVWRWKEGKHTLELIGNNYKGFIFSCDHARYFSGMLITKNGKICFENFKGTKTAKESLSRDLNHFKIKTGGIGLRHQVLVNETGTAMVRLLPQSLDRRYHNQWDCDKHILHGMKIEKVFCGGYSFYLQSSNNEFYMWRCESKSEAGHYPNHNHEYSNFQINGHRFDTHSLKPLKVNGINLNL